MRSRPAPAPIASQENDQSSFHGVLAALHRPREGNRGLRRVAALPAVVHVASASYGGSAGFAGDGSPLALQVVYP